MSQALFVQAREFIKAKRYDEARAILRGIDHPTAREWLAKLNQIAPESEPEPDPEPEPMQTAPAPSPKEQLIAAREFIKAKRYDEAWAMLREIDHPTAREWLAKLEQIAPAPVPAAPAPSPLEQLAAARVHLAAKRYDEARAMLRGIDHPKAREWLAKLDQIAPVPAEAPAPPAKKADHDEVVREAQRLLLQGEYDRVRDMLKPLNTRVAAFWFDKTAVNQFRSHENLWLDMFRYDLPPGTTDDPAAWKCPVCLRRIEQAPQCPQRGESSCPMKLAAREIEEPRRLSLILEALQHDQTKGIDKLAGAFNAARLEHWRDALIWQRDHLLEPDIRRPAIEAAITLLSQLIEQRRS